MNRYIKKKITYFIQGLLALLPLLVTGYVVYFLISFINGFTNRIIVLLPDFIRDISTFRITIEGICVAFAFLSIMFFGMLVRTVIGSKILKMIDDFFEKVPGLNRIYDATKQVAEIFRSGNRQFFTEPVLVQYPSPGIWAVAFNTGEVSQTFKDGYSDKSYTVFIPTTPNPTSGFLAIMREDQIRKLNISVEDAIKMILTGGMVKNSSGVSQKIAIDL
ncbi:MAG TPA: DUF502 domain-containing protein [Chitinispirillaceae bacterium]|nr:DUF502 domain-containing protein [Chitinispirillaceae bacterium]